jgi:multiple sugar transport system substrate-binding protein
MSTQKKQKGMSRRDFLKLSGTAVGAAVATAACQPMVLPSPTPETAPAEMEAPVVLKGATVNFLGYPMFVPTMNDLFRSFAIDWATQNSVKFNIEMATTSDIAARVATAIETKQGPNIVQYAATPASIVAGLVDITELAEELGDQQEGWYDTAPAVSTAEGKWYAIPMGSHTMMANWRVDWFQEAGYEEFPDTWEELLEAGKMLKAAGHPLGFVFSPTAPFDGLGHSLVVLWSFGGKEFESDGTLALDSQETMDALEFAIEFYNEACDPGVTAYGDGTNNQAFLAGQISSTLNVNTIYLPALESNPEVAEAMDHALPPAGPAGRFSYQGFPFVSVLNHTEGIDREAALAFMRDFFDVSNYAQWIKEGKGYLIPLGPIYEDLPIWDPDPKLALTREVGRLGRWSGYALPSPSPLSSLMQAQFTMSKLFSNACTTGEARQALDDTLREIEDLERQAAS